MITLFEPENPRQVRFIAALGVPTTLALIGLGLWPSIFTIAAILALPAPLIFIAVFIRPDLIARFPKLRLYLEACIGLSILCWVVEALWLFFL